LIKLFKYPCVVEKAAFKQFSGHSSHVTRVKFTYNDNFVISAGGNDKTIIVWETDFSMEHGAPKNHNAEEHKEAF
jgi:WD40 repeat protein